MWKSPFLPLFCGILLSCFSCNEQDPELVPNPIYKACCGADPIEYKNGGHYVYIPNVFTPNKDGVNDKFELVFDLAKIRTVEQYTIYKDTTFEPGPILYSTGLYPTQFGLFFWDGIDRDGNLVVGSFRYEIQLRTTDDQLIGLKGRACAVACGPDAAEFKGREGCFFPSQVDTKGIHDPALPPKEEDCFK
jgi:hypothetical protein